MTGSSPQSAAGASPAPELDNDLWRFACSFYASDGVASACLALQDKLGVDVNILLFTIFARIERGVVLDPSDLGLVDGLVLGWRGEIVQPLRGLRTRLKTGPAPAPSPFTGHLRNRIKAAELEAEQIELALLIDWLDRRPARSGSSTADAETIPMMVTRYFCAQPIEALPPAVEDALASLSRAVRAATKEKRS